MIEKFTKTAPSGAVSATIPHHTEGGALYPHEILLKILIAHIRMSPSPWITTLAFFYSFLVIEIVYLLIKIIDLTANPPFESCLRIVIFLDFFLSIYWWFTWIELENGYPYEGCGR
jgi:hypothetical protein